LITQESIGLEPYIEIWDHSPRQANTLIIPRPILGERVRRGVFKPNIGTGITMRPRHYYIFRIYFIIFILRGHVE